MSDIDRDADRRQSMVAAWPGRGNALLARMHETAAAPVAVTARAAILVTARAAVLVTALAAVLAALAPGCSSGPRPVPGADPAGRTPSPARITPARVTALEFAEQTRAPERALLLGTTATGGSVWLPLARPADTVRVHARAAAGKQPGTVWLTAWLEPAPPPAAAELYFRALDDRYETMLAEPERPAAWAALHAAAAALNKNVTELRYVAVPDPAVDALASEPMSGALLAAAFLASLTGAPVKTRPAIAGMLLPDDTVVDIGSKPAAPAPGHGPGIRDVHDAYARLTGHSLPAPVPVPATAMAMPGRLAAHLGSRYPAWRRVLGQSWAALIQIESAGAVPPELVELARAAVQDGREAERLQAEAAAVPAYERMIRAATAAATAAALWGVIEHVRAGDPAAARSRLRLLAIAAAERLDQARAAAAQRPADTLDDLELSMAAHQWLLRSAGAHATGSQLLAEAEQALDALGPAAVLRPAGREALAAARRAAEILAQAESSAYRAMDLLALARSTRPLPYACAATDIRHVALARAAQAAASLHHLAGLMQGSATPVSSGLPGQPGKPVALAREPGLVMARAAIEHSLLLARTRPDSAVGFVPCTRGPAALSAAMLAHVELSLLMLRAHVEDLEPAARMRMLDDLVARAERKARQHARAAQVATGRIPALARLDYQRARQLARHGRKASGLGSDADQAAQPETARLAALERYWLASLHSQAAVILARNGAPNRAQYRAPRHAQAAPRAGSHPARNPARRALETATGVR